ncbi:hypothetical protein AWB78_07167 [Caballeronia calidae]|uniref:Uncharacterized protein n=1 Tax=Caballeronia calidae TaxID=1777139 RepID=A0A158EDQ7_9BURK|nr:hypothetical protein [Caballeronia calidae]SAL04860.1 hypothetical protein AWB78_07167 [Caballeronia calidae]
MNALSPDARLDRVNLLRRAAAIGGPQINGIVGLEVVKRGDDLFLDLECAFPPAPSDVSAANIVITGGVRRPRIAVSGIQADGSVLHVQVERRGDFSNYTLRIVRNGAPLPGFDPLLSEIVFGFRRECEVGFDCQREPVASLDPLPAAPIDYVARDYQGFRRLMLDRLAVLMPGWKEPGAASVEVTLVEMLAHAADRLAYAQDAVATESYLDTARLRASAKRHAKLVDYAMHDGCNARTFVHIRMREPFAGERAVTATVRAGARFMTRTEGVAAAGTETPEVQQARLDGAKFFEAMADCVLSSVRNRIVIHDYLGALTGLAKGATAMAVADPGRALALAAGDLLLIEQVAEPATGDAVPDFERRHVVRLAEVVEGVDPVGQLDAGGDPVPLELLHLSWSTADALPADFALARVTTNDTIDGIAPAPNQPTLVARGNLVPADHGESVGQETVLPVLKPGRRRVVIPLPDCSVTQAIPFDAADTASELLRPNPALTRPAITASQTGGDGSLVHWQVVPDLFASDSVQTHLVLDVETDAPSVLRSGDGMAGRLPESDMPMAVRYRVGNGTEGDVGAEALAHLLTDGNITRDETFLVFEGQPSDIEAIRNPLAASGIAPETIADVRLRAPIMFNEQRRAVTGADYAKVLETHPKVAAARAVERWTGSWRAIVLLVDVDGGAPLDADLEASFRNHLEPYRLAGHALEFREPVLVPLELAMRVCVLPDVPRADVEERLLQLFSGAVLPDGTLGLFHPNRFSFGEPIRLSRLIAAAQCVGGVRHVEIIGLTRQGRGAGAGDVLETGTMAFGAYEIPILANDPNYPDRGKVSLNMEGGQ